MFYRQRKSEGNSKPRGKFFKVTSYGSPVSEEIFRLVYLSASSKQLLTELVELISSRRAAPLRAKVILSDKIQPGEARLDEETMDILILKKATLYGYAP